jgi:hypothetical protein
LLLQHAKTTQQHLLLQAARPDPQPPGRLAEWDNRDGPITSIQPPTALR